MMNLPLFTVAMKKMLMKMMIVELVLGSGLGGGADGEAGLRPLRLAPEVTSGGQRASARGGRRLAEGGGGGAAGANGVRPWVF